MFLYEDSQDDTCPRYTKEDLIRVAEAMREMCFKAGGYEHWPMDPLEAIKKAGLRFCQGNRTPATLDEARRDYAMFGKFVAGFVCEFDLGDMEFFADDWATYYHSGLDNMTQHSKLWPEFVAFVKEEMGK